MMLYFLFLVADPLQDRRSNPNSESWYGNNPDYQHLINTASQYGQNPGHQNSVADTRWDDRQSYPQKPIPNGSLNNQSPGNQKPGFLKPSRKIKPFELTPDLKMAYESIDSQRPAGSGSKTYLGSITVLKGNTYNVDPNSTNIYGSVTQISGSYLYPVEQERLDRINQKFFKRS
ncbi:GSCOCT00013082001.2-RA-CDS [Cotesia congregata]|uniref:Cc_ep2.5_CcPL2.093_pseudo n=1 Tax=Cotesia congregata TaxID=51543 RepID=A0A8J2HBQ4_COTCN|nr:GSCOCT00013082001.2-RA-CDS [Cotesia congregata]CAG5092458.1 cc_ep2.5_CcPL2.093_pseudo [Cotesia congregata]